MAITFQGFDNDGRWMGERAAGVIGYAACPVCGDTGERRGDALYCGRCAAFEAELEARRMAADREAPIGIPWNASTVAAAIQHWNKADVGVTGAACASEGAVAPDVDVRESINLAAGEQAQSEDVQVELPAGRDGDFVEDSREFRRWGKKAADSVMAGVLVAAAVWMVLLPVCKLLAAVVFSGR